MSWWFYEGRVGKCSAAHSWSMCVFSFYLQVNQWCDSGIYLLASQAVDKCQSQEGAESALTDIENFLESAEKNQLTELKNLHNQFEMVLSEDLKVWCRGNLQRGAPHWMFTRIRITVGCVFVRRAASRWCWSDWRMFRRCLRSGMLALKDCRPNRRGPFSPLLQGLIPHPNVLHSETPRELQGVRNVSGLLCLQLIYSDDGTTVTLPVCCTICLQNFVLEWLKTWVEASWCEACQLFCIDFQT